MADRCGAGLPRATVRFALSRQAVLTIVFLASLTVPAGSQRIVNRFATPVAARGVRAASDMRVDTSASGGVTRRDNHTLAGAAIGLVVGALIGHIMPAA